MTLEQLRIFVAVAEREHVTQAARDLNLTQSATSAAVAALEARYATRLFDRVGRRIELTEAGRLFLVEARAVLARAASAETVLADLAGLKRGSIALAASQTVANYWLPPLMNRYRLKFPGINVTLKIGNTESVAVEVHNGAVDVGFIEGAIDDPTLSVTTIAEDELALVVNRDHAWAGKGAVDPSELKDTRWVLRETGSGTRAAFDTMLAGFGLKMADLDIGLELPSNEAVRAAIEDGAGAAVISRLAVASALKAGSLVALELPLPKRKFFALRHKEHHMTQAEREFYNLIRSYKPK